jgi:cell pole-organizing protein PopZ
MIFGGRKNKEEGPEFDYVIEDENAVEKTEENDLHGTEDEFLEDEEKELNTDGLKNKNHFDDHFNDYEEMSQTDIKKEKTSDKKQKNFDTKATVEDILDPKKFFEKEDQDINQNNKQDKIDKTVKEEVKLENKKEKKEINNDLKTGYDTKIESTKVANTEKSKEDLSDKKSETINNYKSEIQTSTKTAKKNGNGGFEVLDNENGKLNTGEENIEDFLGNKTEEPVDFKEKELSSGDISYDVKKAEEEDETKEIEKEVAVEKEAEEKLGITNKASEINKNELDNIDIKEEKLSSTEEDKENEQEEQTKEEKKDDLEEDFTNPDKDAFFNDEDKDEELKVTKEQEQKKSDKLSENVKQNSKQEQKNIEGIFEEKTKSEEVEDSRTKEPDIKKAEKNKGKTCKKNDFNEEDFFCEEGEEGEENNMNFNDVDHVEEHENDNGEENPEQESENTQDEEKNTEQKEGAEQGDKKKPKELSNDDFELEPLVDDEDHSLKDEDEILKEINGLNLDEVQKGEKEDNKKKKEKEEENILSKKNKKKKKTEEEEENEEDEVEEEKVEEEPEEEDEPEKEDELEEEEVEEEEEPIKKKKKSLAKTSKNHDKDFEDEMASIMNYEKVKKDNVISEEVKKMAQDSISKLQNLKSKKKQLTNLGSMTMEDMVHSVLKQELSDWLDEHLPAIVEEIVQREIEKIMEERK